MTGACRFLRSVTPGLAQRTGAILFDMTALALALVLLSAVAHSTWNLLLKRSAEKELFVWWLLATSSILMVPLGVVLFWLHPFSHPGWAFVLATSALHILYFLLLGRSYSEGDLSLVYPIARGVGPMLVPILAAIFFGESVAGLAIIGIVAIVVGIYTVSWWGNFRNLVRAPADFLRNRDTRYATFTGLTIASYAMVDKRGVDHVEPFLYMYLLTVGASVGMFPYVLRKWGLARIGRAWQANPGPIVASSLLAFLAYGLVLTAFSLSRVSYITPAREVGIVLGVILGVFLLKEPFGAGRLLGSSFIVVGLVLIAISP